MPKIAILVPTYNGAPHIEQAIHSIMAAKPTAHGISALYISDDHSQDDTVSRIQGCWDNSVPLHLTVTPQNQGLYGNHNAGLKNMVADGIEWALILHQDDYAKSNWLEIMVATINATSNPIVSVCSSYDNFWNDGTVVAGEEIPDSPPTEVQGTTESIHSTLIRGCWWHISGVALKIDTLAQMEYFDASLPHWADWDWTLRTFQKGYSILYLPRTLIGWRQHDNSYSSHSMRTVWYVQQQITVLDRYKYVLSKREYLQWHGQQASYALRRTFRALQLRNRQFLKAGVQTMLLFGKHAVTHLW